MMKKVINIVAVVAPVLVLFGAGAMPALAAADRSETTASVARTGGDSQSDGSSDSSGTGLTGDDGTETVAETESHTTPESRDAAEAKVQANAQKLLREFKDNRKGHSQAQRQQYCTAHKQGLDQKLASLRTNALRFQTKIDNVLSQAADYQQANNVQLSNYADLLSKAQTAQVASAAAVASLANLTPTVDCNNTSTASDVATFKAAAEQARTALMTYRDSVRSLVTALAGAKGDN